MADCGIFDEDEVCIPTPGGFKYGLVVESSEYISSDEDDYDDEHRVKKGTVKVAWHPLGKETVVPEKKLILVDRSLMPGDVVRRLISGTESQRGFVEDITVSGHVKILGTEQWIYNVDIKDVLPIQDWDPEPEVVLDSWVGAIMEIREDIIVRFPDGARCQLHDAGLLNLEDMNERNDRRVEHSEFAVRCFYPGQELCGCYDDYDGATWLTSTNLHGADASGAKSLYNLSVIVEEVETKSVEVRWICKGFTKLGTDKDNLESPPSLVEGEALKRMRKLDCFEHCHRQIGDKGYYVVKETDAVLHSLSPRHHLVPDILQVMNEGMTVLGASNGGLYVAVKDCEKVTSDNKDNARGDKQMPVVAVKANGDAGDDADDEFEDVDNDNSDASSTHSATDSVPVPKRKNRKRPGLQTRNMRKYRGKRAKTKPKKEDRVVNPGDKVPVEIWYTFSRCGVRWQDGSLEENVPSPQLFPIHHLDELEFFPGDFVVDTKGNVSTDYGAVVSCDHRERTCIVKWMEPYVQGKTERPAVRETTEVSVYDIKDHPDYKFRVANTVIRVGGFEGSEADLEAIGQVYRLDQQGLLHVWWPNGTVTVCYPQDLYLIGEEDDGTSSDEDEWTSEEEEEESESGTGSDVSWETEDEVELTDATTDDDTPSKPKEKPAVGVTDAKKKDVDELIQRVQSALNGLLNVFLNVPGPFFKNSKQVFQDILAIFKRCKEMEKIMKSSFFDEAEVTDLIHEIKEQLRKEKTNKMAQHVAQMYESRNNISLYNGDIGTETADSACAVNGNNVVESHSNSPTTPVGVNQKSNIASESVCLPNGDLNLSSPSLPATNQNSSSDSAALTNQERSVAEASLAAGKRSTTSCLTASQQTVINSAIDSMSGEQVRRILSQYASKIEDPIEQIIFDTCLHSAVAQSKNEQTAKSKVSDNIGDCHDHSDIALGEDGHIGNESVIVEQACDHILNTLDMLDNDDNTNKVKELKTVALQKVQEMFQSCEKVSHPGIKTPEIESEIIAKPDSQSQSQQTDSGVATTPAGIPVTHRTLCIRVCTALNCRLLKIQQDLTRKWMAYQFGCEEGASDRTLYEKMEEKMIEALDKTGEPLKLVTDTEVKVPEQKEMEGTATQECISELQTLENSRTSPSGSAATVSSGSVSPELAHDTAQADEASQKSGFELCSETSAGHWFKFKDHKPENTKSFNVAVRKELNLLRTSLPEGIMVKAFEDRMDLYSVMIRGPSHTPYEDGLFMFDIQLPADYPSHPPLFHFLSFTNERLNPNLYEDGKVCVSLLGTWSGKGSEMWTNKSNLLQVLVSIQGLILVSEPYYNEAGYEKQRGTQIGQENSRMYNEMAILKLVQSMTKMALTPPLPFEDETRDHLRQHALGMIKRMEAWISNCRGPHSQSQPDAAAVNQSDSTTDSKSCNQSSTNDNTDIGANEQITPLGFPLLPASKGFRLSLKKHLNNFECVLKEHIWEH